MRDGAVRRLGVIVVLNSRHGLGRTALTVLAAVSQTSHAEEDEVGDQEERGGPPEDH